MSKQQEIYLGSVCLDRNRWGSREPSFLVSEWLPRFKDDGFDGVELWEFHFLNADQAERDRLVAEAASIAMYNTYVGFEDEAAEAREKNADAIRQLAPSGVKYNVGGDPNRLDEYRRNLLAWADQLPESWRLLCECHCGSVLEEMDPAAAFHADLDPARFGAIVHVPGDAEGVEGWMNALGSRVTHLHVQLRGPESDPSVPENYDRLAAAFAMAREHGFSGSVALEFTRGIGRDEDIETIYANACVDLACCRKALG